MKIETTENKVTLSSIVFVAVMLACLVMLSFSAHANLIGTGDNTGSWNGLDIQFSGVGDESCRLIFGHPCPLSDVGKNSYTNLEVAGTQFLSGDQLSLLILEPNFYTVFNITIKNAGSWALCEVNCSPFAPTRPTFNLLTGASNSAIGGASFLTHFEITEASAVPVPAAVWLFGSGLVGLVGVARRKA